MVREDRGWDNVLSMQHNDGRPYRHCPREVDWIDLLCASLTGDRLRGRGISLGVVHYRDCAYGSAPPCERIIAQEMARCRGTKCRRRAPIRASVTLISINWLSLNLYSCIGSCSVRRVEMYEVL